MAVDLFWLYLNDRERETQTQFVSQINFNVMQAELLELNAAKVVNIGRVAFHFFQFELHFGLGENVLLIYSDDARSLEELAGSAAPARPNAQPQIVDRQRGRGHDVQDADQSLHSVEFAPHVLT